VTKSDDNRPFASTDEEATLFSHDDNVKVFLSPLTAAFKLSDHATADHADADPVRGNQATGRRRKYSKDDRTDWAAVERTVQNAGVQ
jgi:hypothetical protein